MPFGMSFWSSLVFQKPNQAALKFFCLLLLHLAQEFCMFKTLFVLFTLALLSACVTPMHLGIPDAEWQNYSPEERKKIKSGYYELMKSHVGVEEEKIVPDGSSLHVRLSGGNVLMPPFSHPVSYTPVEFDVESGASEKIILEAPGGEQKTTLHICYRNKTLYLDPSRYDPTKRLGSIQLHYSPIWNRGFTYENVSSSGYVHLSHVNVNVKKYDNNDPSDNGN